MAEPAVLAVKQFFTAGGLNLPRMQLTEFIRTEDKMADWEKKGAKGGNVDAGPGSKSGKGGGDAGASATEKTHNVEFAKGGDTHMFGEQEAGSRTGGDKSPSTGKPDDAGPGEKFAAGGKTKMFGFQGAIPAREGITSAR